jgi:hypothetical protein
MLAEISFYNVVLFVHIAAVVLAFGVTFSFPIVMSVDRRSHARHMGFYHRMQALIGGRLIGPLGGLVLLPASTSRSATLRRARARAPCISARTTSGCSARCGT